jgi:thioredoxin-related protein
MLLQIAYIYFQFKPLNMRPVLLLSLLSLFLLRAAAQPAPPPAEQVLKDACSVAEKENKKVFIIFHASWCGWCRKLDSSLNDQQCKKIFDDNFVIRHLRVDEHADRKEDENPGGMELMKKHNGEGGLPYWLIFDASGNLLADSRGPSPKRHNQLSNVGCPAEPHEVEHFVRVLKRSGIHDPQQLEVIRERFLKNRRQPQ